MTQTQRLRIGPPPGAPGVAIYQEARENNTLNSAFGTTAAYGILKRGPMGIAVPVRGNPNYQEIFGDPYDPQFHLFEDSDHLTPDWVDGFFGSGGGVSTLLLTRLDLDGKAKKAELTLKGRNGLPVLKLLAANEGRWAGSRIEVPASSIVAASQRTFTVVAPGTLANQFKGASASFSGNVNSFEIVSNTAADELTGETIFTVAAQYDLVQAGVTGPIPLAGTASFSRTTALTGTVTYDLQEALTGIVDITGSLVSGTGTLFTDELFEGATIYRGSEARIVQSIANDLTLIVSEPFSVNSTGTSLNTASLTVTGTGTAFDTDLAVGEDLIVVIAGQNQRRKIASIASATSLKLTSGFTAAVPSLSTAYKENRTLTGVGTTFIANVAVGDYIINPLRRGVASRVVSIASDLSLELSVPFSDDFTGATISKQSKLATISLQPANPTDGLAVSVGQGLTKPDTHFSMSVFFNGNQVIQLDDLSLESSDPDYVVNKLIGANTAYDDGTSTFAKYLEAEVVWDSTYTTAKGSDVRPSVGNATVVAVSPTRIYTTGALPYAKLGGTLIYPDIYESPSNYLRAAAAQPPLTLSGTVSSLGVAVTGVSTAFLTELAAGDYFYDPISKTARQVQQVNSDTSLVLTTAFASNLASGSTGVRSGWISIQNASDISGQTSIGAELSVVVPEYLSGGYDGDTANLKSTYWTKYTDLDFNHLETAAGALGLGLVRVACPGVGAADIQRAFAAYCLQRAYEFRVEIPSYMSDVQADTFVRVNVGLNDAISVAYPCYGYSRDPDGGVNDRFGPVTGDIMGAEAALAVAASGYHQMFAGVRATLSPRIKRMVYPLNPAQEARLNTRGIQPIKLVGGNIVVFGIKAPSLSEQYRFIHSSRIQKNLVRVFRESIPILERLFEANDPNTVAQLVFILNKFAENEYEKGVFSRFLPFSRAVTVYDIAAAAGNTTESLLTSLIQAENGKISINFGYIPNGLVELVEILVSQDNVVTKFGSAVTSSF